MNSNLDGQTWLRHLGTLRSTLPPYLLTDQLTMLFAFPLTTHFTSYLILYIIVTTRSTSSNLKNKENFVG